MLSHCMARCMFLSPSARLHSCELLVIKLSISPIIFSHIFLAPPPHFPRCTKTNIFGVIMVVRADISHYNPWCSRPLEPLAISHPRPHKYSMTSNHQIYVKYRSDLSIFKMIFQIQKSKSLLLSILKP